MTVRDWQSAFAKSMTVFLNGSAITERDRRGERVIDDSFLVLFNAHDEPLDFRLPTARWGKSWLRLIDTADTLAEGDQVKAGETVVVEARSLEVLHRLG
jgi:glycogen operon protein